MGNPNFRFKQFVVNQDRSAMKVCTDACLFGSLLASPSLKGSGHTALDIGTGTGLLSLMLAQKNSSIRIDALEIDEAAAVQATENFRASPWKERLQVIQEDARKFIPSHTYDFIFSNPPFFENDLKSSDAGRNLALHSEQLTLEELLQLVKKILSHQGIFAILLPIHRKEYFEKLAAREQLFLRESFLIKQTPGHPFFRVVLFLGREQVVATETVITIQGADRQYTADFCELLKDYYLYL